MTGSGPLEVIRDGAAIQGTWSRPNLGDLTRLLNSKGKVIPLTPGVTWISWCQPPFRIPLPPDLSGSRLEFRTWIGTKGYWLHVRTFD